MAAQDQVIILPDATVENLQSLMQVTDSITTNIQKMNASLDKLLEKKPVVDHLLATLEQFEAAAKREGKTWPVSQQ
eukprot:EC725575.1.p1 GENE.EC725575.1~~EC725575.1.p1  ORF type:complete len:87 (+),score=16.63 EC725575.1:36-263(+)